VSSWTLSDRHHVCGCPTTSLSPAVTETFVAITGPVPPLMRCEKPPGTGTFFGEEGADSSTRSRTSRLGLYSKLTGLRIRFSLEIDLKC
jgi:hypothetical protein